jgi:hypothetical protein
MNTLSEFVNKWTGKTIDTDGIYPNQCMDLMHQYLIDMFGLTDPRILAQDSAYKVYTNFDNVFGHEMFERIANTPTGVPQSGDVLFFGQAIGQWGHVCMFVDGNTDTFRSFDANWPTGTLPHIQTHNYTGVLGWLRYKQPAQSTIPSGDDCPLKLTQVTQERDRLNGVISGKDETISHLGDTINAKNAEITTANTMISSLNSQVLLLTEQLATATEQAKKVIPLTENLTSCETSKQNYATDLSKCQTQVGKIKSQLVPKKYLSLKIYNLIMNFE